MIRIISSHRLALLVERQEATEKQLVAERRRNLDLERRVQHWHGAALRLEQTLRELPQEIALPRRKIQALKAENAELRDRVAQLERPADQPRIPLPAAPPGDEDTLTMPVVARLGSAAWGPQGQHPAGGAA
jgi:hypothetical protein